MRKENKSASETFKRTGRIEEKEKSKKERRTRRKMKKIKRILALLLVIFLIAMVFVTLYCAVTGSPYFMASLFVMLGLPLLIYAYMFIYRIVKDKDEK